MPVNGRIAVIAVGLCPLLTAGCDLGEVAGPITVPLDDADPHLAARLTEHLAAVRAAPQSGELRGRLAMAYEVNGFPEAATAAYEQAARLAPDEFAWPYFLALLQAKAGDLAAALASLDQALAIDAEYVPAWLWRGEWLVDTGDYSTAEEAYEQAAALDAGTPAVAGLGRIRSRQGRMAEVLALLEPVVAETPHPHLNRMLGEAYRNLGRQEDARIAFARARLAEPLQWFDPRQLRKTKFIAGYKNQMAHAQDLLAVGRYDDALAMLEPWREDYPSDPLLLTNLGWAHLSRGDLDRAEEILRKGVDQHTAHSSGYYFNLHLGRLLAKRGDDDEALHYLRRASKINPGQAEPHEEEAKILLRAGETDGALEAFDLALQKGTDEPAKLLQIAGVAEAARGRWHEAIARFEEATGLDPSLTMAYVHLGRSLVEAGRYDEARAAFDWADRLATHPRDVAAARRALAIRLAELGG